MTGAVFEKRLILKYIEENGKEPGTDDELHPDDLLEIKTTRVVRPRPPNFTSLPSLLKAFQDEWDALVLESYNTKEQLARTREELATALYQHDAAVRVIARLTKERDEARDALSKVTVAPSGDAGGDAMAVDNEGLPEELVTHVEEIQAQCVVLLPSSALPSADPASDYPRAAKNDRFPIIGRPQMMSRASSSSISPTCRFPMLLLSTCRLASRPSAAPMARLMSTR